jgi:hypothetical protein
MELQDRDGHKVTRTPRRRQIQMSETAAKTTASKTPAKVTKAAAVKTPSTREYRKLLGAAVIKNAADFALKYRMPKGTPMSREDVLIQVGSWMSYVPGDFDSRLPMITVGGRRTVA